MHWPISYFSIGYDSQISLARTAKYLLLKIYDSFLNTGPKNIRITPIAHPSILTSLLKNGFCVNTRYALLKTLTLKSSKQGAQWLSGRVLDSGPRGHGFEPHQRHCIVVIGQDTFILA